MLEGERGKAGLWGGERGEGGVEGGGDGVRGGAGRGVGDFIGFPLVLKPTACLPHSGSTKTAHIYIYIYIYIRCTLRYYGPPPLEVAKTIENQLNQLNQLEFPVCLLCV